MLSNTPDGYNDYDLDSIEEPQEADEYKSENQYEYWVIQQMQNENK